MAGGSRMGGGWHHIQNREKPMQAKIISALRLSAGLTAL